MYDNNMMSMIMNAPLLSMPQENQQAAPTTAPLIPMPTAAGTNPIMMNPTMLNPMMMQHQMMMIMQTMMMGMNNNSRGGNNNNNNTGGGPNNNINTQNNANHKSGAM